MLIFDANDPEIRRAKIINVLNSFAGWSFVTGIFCFLLGPECAIRFGAFAGLVLLTCGFFWVFLGISLHEIFGSNPYNVLRYCYIIITFLLCNACLSFWFRFPGEMSALSLFLCSFVWSVKKTFEQHSVGLYLYSGYTAYNSAQDSDTPQDPQMAFCFESWNPLRSYGKLLFFIGFFLTTFSLTQVFITHKYSYNTGLALAGMGLPIAVSGFGLSRFKEWARVITMLLHGVILIGGLIQSVMFFMGFRNSFYIMPFLIVLFPVFHWCYFVIRTLCNPVVKYVYLRNGHYFD